MKKKLGVNIDHVATVRQARRGTEPIPYLAALAAQRGGADGITIHLREDRRHIQDHDLKEIKKAIKIPLNLEMAFTQEMTQIALRSRPEKICLVPEKRQELTTEGGLDVCRIERALKKAMPGFHAKGIEVSLFIDPVSNQIECARRVGADAIEIHTGAYAQAKGVRRKQEYRRIKKAVEWASKAGLKVNAGHGLDYQNIFGICHIREIEEFNIGHSIVSRALFVGMEKAVREMKRLIR
ncbi:MAG: pyridoxine 5'-phosphate synthase [Candidatus Omnitrophica bacterium]|nr:pyridoxine 5'-phosphate synthase [Candidatus Omnitrophota bacterium]